MLGNLATEMKLKKITQSKLAEVLGLSAVTVYKKINGITDFTAKEMFAIQKAFFPDKNLEYLFAKVE